MNKLFQGALFSAAFVLQQANASDDDTWTLTAEIKAQIESICGPIGPDEFCEVYGIAYGGDGFKINDAEIGKYRRANRPEDEE